MAKFLNTSATTYYLEELIKKCTGNLFLVSPFVKVAPRLRDLIVERAASGVDVRLVYGKTSLSAAEVDWLRGVDSIKTSYCENLHAKCYLTEAGGVITSLNLYEFSQVNNYEMGVYFSRRSDPEIFENAFEEIKRILRVSHAVDLTGDDEEGDLVLAEAVYEKLTTSKLAKQVGVSTESISKSLVESGYLELREGRQFITEAGKAAGGEFKFSKRFGPYFLWPPSVGEQLKNDAR
ncbi:phospholipase D family protein [Blastopirellula retiformator]|uniref:phospholipase D family protein n=1 Tax=Blastopirellula retiformator TaxID=2527970 RepID=UPI0011B83755|nr:phospholipase D family protein [Blastopirellula retiformator]